MNAYQMNQDEKRLARAIEELFEDDNFYGRDIVVLSLDLSGPTEKGFFKDPFNNRVFSFEIGKNGVSYKPALNFKEEKDSVDCFDSLLPQESKESEENFIRRFDAFSAGFSSVFTHLDASRPKPTKRATPYKCTAPTVYSCGFSCIGVKKTCWIDRGNLKGKDASISLERINNIRKLANEIREGIRGRGGFGGSPAALEKLANTIEKYRNMTEIKKQAQQQALKSQQNNTQNNL